MHNKEYALKLVQDKQNGINNYSYSQIASLILKKDERLKARANKVSS